MATINDFFTLYNKIFYEIPKEGETESHRFLVKESGDYIGADGINDSIQVLLDEIASLREESLILQKENIYLTLQAAGADLGGMSIEELFGTGGSATLLSIGQTGDIGGATTGGGGIGSVGGGGIGLVSGY